METLTAWIFSILMTVAPPERTATKNEPVDDVIERYTTTSSAMAQVVEDRGSLFQGKDGVYKTAALLIAVTKFESELAGDVAYGQRRGDHGKSWCYMQLHIDGQQLIWGDEEMKSWTGEDLVTDWTKCFSAGHEVLRVSLQACSRYKDGNILSLYTTGSCQVNTKAQHRWNYAHWILRNFPVPTAS